MVRSRGKRWIGILGPTKVLIRIVSLSLGVSCDDGYIETNGSRLGKTLLVI